jgi:mannosyltransferase OCH1-like enzyme
MIPKTIHYCWFGQQTPSALMHRCMESWHRLMPDYRVKEWNAGNIRLDCAYAKAVARGRLWSKLSNYVRLQALHEEGGIYLDTDVEIVRRFDPLLADRCCLGFQLPWHETDWVNNAALGAEPGHPFLARCMEVTRQLYDDERRICRSPVVTTLVLKEMGLRHYGAQRLGGAQQHAEVRLYPTAAFYPHSWSETYSPQRITAETYAVHHWAGTWLKRRSPMVDRTLKSFKRFRRALGLTSSQRAA